MVYDIEKDENIMQLTVPKQYLEQESSIVECA